MSEDVEKSLRDELMRLHLLHQFERRNGDHLRGRLRAIAQGDPLPEVLAEHELALEKKRRASARKKGIL